MISGSFQSISVLGLFALRVCIVTMFEPEFLRRNHQTSCPCPIKGLQLSARDWSKVPFQKTVNSRIAG